ncbi:MAG: hypothetical protein ACXV8Q_07255 [Methylobacter sp.]
MSNNQQYNLWFVNQSVSAGKVCVYQDEGNVTANQANLKILAWMLTGANPSVQVNFKWTTDYNFAWFDYSSPRSQQIIAASIDTGNSVKFSRNQYGYYFQAPTTNSPSGQLSIQSDNSIPLVDTTVVGIGLHNAGTFAYPAKPNINSVFKPVQDSNLKYWISFGSYLFEENDPIDVLSLNVPAKISFPYGVYKMTAVLNPDNQWTIYPGPPDTLNILRMSPMIVYEAGKGIVCCE